MNAYLARGGQALGVKIGQSYVDVGTFNGYRAATALLASIASADLHTALSEIDDRIVALLNDDTTEVGRVHLGIVHVFKLAEPKLEKREAMITGLTFLSKEELLSRRETMETWSQICLDSLERLLL